jgi:hypothetical protein
VSIGAFEINFKAGHIKAQGAGLTTDLPAQRYYGTASKVGSMREKAS